MPEKFNPNSFAPFLDAVKESKERVSSTLPSPITILQRLAAAPGRQMDVSSLLSVSELPLEVFTNALREFETAGLVTMRAENSRQQVVLSPTGEQVASVKL